MKNLKFRILLTNISRIIRSIIFINLSNIVLGVNKVFGTSKKLDEIQITCYDMGPTESITSSSVGDKIISYFQENIFILIVPIVVIVILVVFITKKMKQKKEWKNKNDK